MNNITIKIANKISFNTLSMMDKLDNRVIYKLVPMVRVRFTKEVKLGIFGEIETLMQRKLEHL